MTLKNLRGHPDTSPHKQKRAMITRKQLLRSARKVLARDGFEHARIEEIATKAGKTRGAFYDNFKDKEEVFFALFEENLDSDVARLNSQLAGLSTGKQRVEAFGNYLSDLARDRERVLLNLEFKLYAIRHPRERKRLAAQFGAMRLRGSTMELSRLMATAQRTKLEATPGDSVAICGLLDGLALSHFFDPESFDDLEVAHYLKAWLRQTLSVPRQRKGMPRGR